MSQKVSRRGFIKTMGAGAAVTVGSALGLNQVRSVRAAYKRGHSSV